VGNLDVFNVAPRTIARLGRERLTLGNFVDEVGACYNCGVMSMIQSMCVDWEDSVFIYETTRMEDDANDTIPRNTSANTSAHEGALDSNETTAIPAL